MAEALWESLGAGRWESASAGSRPSGYVHPLAVLAMQELDLDISAHVSKSLEEFRDQEFDLVVTVCDNAKDSCPVFPGARETLHWPFDDPADATGDVDEQLMVFRRVRDEIREKIRQYLESST